MYNLSSTTAVWWPHRLQKSLSGSCWAFEDAIQQVAIRKHSGVAGSEKCMALEFAICRERDLREGGATLGDRSMRHSTEGRKDLSQRRRVGQDGWSGHWESQSSYPDSREEQRGDKESDGLASGEGREKPQKARELGLLIGGWIAHRPTRGWAFWTVIVVCVCGGLWLAAKVRIGEGGGCLPGRRWQFCARGTRPTNTNSEATTCATS